MLKPYSENDSDLVNSENNRTQNQRNLAEQIEQLEKMQPFLEQAENDVQILKERKIKQQSIKEQRTIKQEMIDSLTRELSSYENLISEYKKQKENLRDIQDQIDKLNKNFEGVKQQVIPIQTDFDTTMVNLSNLKKITKGKDISELISILKNYLRDIKNLITKFTNIEKNQNQLSDDVKIVFEIRDNMDEKIDLRVTSLMSGKVRTGLHQDNKDVHKAGAAKMNIRYSTLEQEKVDLLSANPDLKEFLNQKNLLTNLKSILDEFIRLQDNMSSIQAEIDGVVREADYAKKSVDKSEQRLNKDFKNFTTADQNKKITDLQKQMTELIIDPKLEDKISEANSRQSHYQESINKLNADKIKTQTNIQNYNQKIKELNSKIEEITTQVENNLKILKPYMINGYQLDKIVETLNFVNQNRSQIRNHRFSDLSEKIGYYIRHNGADGEPDRYALDSIFEERGYTAIASSIRQQRSIDKNDLRVVSFDINEARKLISDDKEAVSKSLEQLNSGNEAAQLTYTGAAVHQISEQYDLVDEYNDILAHGVRQSQGIQLKVALNPVNVDEQVISEARNSELTERPALLKEIQKRLERLANDTEIAEDDDQFMESAHKLLDIRQWSDFQVLIHRKQAADGEFELVDNNFVQSGGSGAEKAQAMVLPLLLVPKMLLQRSKKSDSPHMVMFDEFADKLDPDTAKSFARTIDDFGFSFIATMPSGAQNKVLADGIENIAYDVIAPKNGNDGKFHNNIVREAMIWQEE
ncbi:SbcC/MukB-like Walker B domain-containing protein [Companilactobacillus insicii]|uniref:SbcC/MukB-like Walker B domain-containing protein n=1 Tax=Companilactobacillus insicii TaxID=1732567 RepID=UPI001FE9CEF8|nr:SbcC/MukB-like Walker B domain-containing protein [Companilactobacillus insicii]